MVQERGKREAILSPSAKRARRIDLNNKVQCWIGHIKIAQDKGDGWQMGIGEGRLRELRNQIGKD